MFKELGVHPQILFNYSTISSEHSWEDLCIRLKIQQRTLLITLNKQG